MFFDAKHASLSPKRYQLRSQKKFIRPGANVIKPFAALSYEFL
jgi:hypothetical protein